MGTADTVPSGHSVAFPPVPDTPAEAFKHPGPQHPVLVFRTVQQASLDPFTHGVRQEGAGGPREGRGPLARQIGGLKS